VECSGPTTSVTLPPATAVDDIPGVVTVTGGGVADFGPGSFATGYSARDAAGNTSLCQSTVTVADTTPPIVTVDQGATTAVLSPADDQLHTITLADCGVELNDLCQGPLPLEGNARITCVSSDESVEEHAQDCRDPRHHHGGCPGPDIVLTSDTAVQLRASTNSGGDGRVYTIAFEASDPAGNKTEGRCTVSVPGRRRHGRPADSGADQTVCSADR